MKAAANFCFFSLLVGAVSLSVSDLQAQTRPSTRVPRSAPRTAAAPAAVSPTAGGSVAVVDISYIFKNHAGFKATMDKMKEEVQAYEQQVVAEQKAIAKEQEQLEQFRPGSPDYQRLERTLADKVAQLQIDTQLKKKEFLTRESMVYFNVYEEVTNAVREFAEQKGIDLVLRYSGEPIDPEDRASILQGVNRALVYHRNLDITREILDRVNRSARVSQQPRRRAPQQ